ncbi:ankyrin repeat domain-containing protein [Aeromonas salmonicida]|uniref:ankyrin repeat domain-containing protein n=1 Tax=Aeromonas salmonicida TaxID=645 RepID=UPI00259F0425|nr:ankyrin repeat domain-containing protein [Aeromonas salmonicida]MDM5065652.1 ankyrin repeat domain-containing protein [Aeromonas salmonicida]
MRKNIEEIKETLLGSEFKAFQKSLDDFDIHECDEFGNNILHYYIKESKDVSFDYKDVICAILRNGLDINDKQSKGPFKRSALHIAVFMKLTNIVDHLIELGADVNSTDANGNTIINTAVMWYRNQDSYLIERLINSGADIFIKNNHGVSAYSLAQAINNFDVKLSLDN